MQDKLDELKALIAPVNDLIHASSVLQWDQETYMPDGSAQPRSDQIATLESLAHRFATDEKIGKLLGELKDYEQQLDYDSDEAGFIRVTRREYERRVKVPEALVGEIYRNMSLGTEAWKEARAKKDFSIWLPLLDRMVDLRKQWAECFAPYANIYNPLLDYYEPGIDYDQIAAVFGGLKPHLVELVKAIGEHQDAVDTSVLAAHYPAQAQLDFSREAAAQIGYDFKHGRLDLTAHPFTIHFGRDDVRITTRVSEDDLVGCLMSVIHEAGHAMYEQGTSPAFYRSYLENGASMAVHELQSRFYENIIGRSRAFWQFFYPQLQAAFPHFKNVDREAFYKALNQSHPSLIRTEADEVTYGLHIMLRFELENELFNGKVKVADLPKEWNARMQAYLGITPPDDVKGVMQDIHWAQGLMGYFPDYLLGSIFSVQLWDRMQQDIPDVTAQIARGAFGAILGWQREHIHRHGQKFTLPELSERATGGPLRWEPYMDYLKAKYGDIYGL